MTELIIDPERQKHAKKLSRISRRVMLGELVFGFLYSLAWLYFGWSIALRDIILTLTSSEWSLVIGFAVVYVGIYSLITLPMLYYEGYVLPHRFGLSTQTFRAWVVDQLKGALLGIVLGGFLLEVVYVLLRSAPETWWLWVGIILLLVNVILANLAPIILMPIFYKFQSLEAEYEELMNRLILLAEKAHTHIKGVYKFDMSSKTTTANAALTGMGKTRRIILGDTLLDEFTVDEIETILAHELAHHVYKDIPVGIVVQTFITFVGLYLASLVMNWGVSKFGFNGVADLAAMPLLVLALGFYGLVTMPVENAYSRWREMRADLYALKATGNGDAYASALVRLANQNLSEIDPEPWVELFFHSHPALGKRIDNARSYTNKIKAD